MKLQNWIKRTSIIIEKIIVQKFIFNCIIIVLAVYGNYTFQVFCQPVLLAKIVLLVCYSTTLIGILVNEKYNKLLLLLSFINGISFFISIYCIYFLGLTGYVYSIIGIFYFGVGLLSFVPVYLAISIFKFQLFTTKNNRYKLSFVIGILFCFTASVYVGNKYKQALLAIEKCKDSGYSTLETNYFTELILGKHFKYHTRYCEYDGWRPPLHNPALIIGLWLNGYNDAIDTSLEGRIFLYKKFFPHNAIKQNCSCAINESNNYFKDGRLK